jgi:hypothetical protein
MHRLAWAGATLILAALSFAAGRMTLGVRIMPEIVATLPGDESEFSRELDARLRERFPIGTSQDKLIGYLVGGEGLGLLENWLGCTLPESQQEDGLSVGAVGPQGASRWRDYPRRSVRARSFAP